MSDADLVERALAGDEDAFADIYRRHHAVVYRFARMMCGQASLAEEITQDTFVRLIADLPRYDATRSSLCTYLYGIVRNLARNRLRRERRFVPWTLDTTPEPQAADDQDHALIYDQELARLRAAIRALPPRYREVLILDHLHGLSYAEIAAIVRVPIGTIRSRLSRARVMVAHQLRETSEAGDAPARRMRCAI